MDAQARLVRLMMQRLNDVFATITNRDQQTGFQKIKSACAGVVCGFALFGQQALAQGWGPTPDQYTYSNQSVDYGAYAPPTDSAAYASLVPDRRDPGDRLLPRIGQVFEPYAHQSWARVEYLNAKIHHSSPQTLGTPIRDTAGNVLDIREPFDLPVFDPVNTPPLELSAPAVGVSTEDVDWDDVAGIRGSFGIPIDKYSWFEGSVTGLAEQSESLVAPTIPPSSLNPLFGIDPVQFIVIPYTIDGQAGSISDIYTDPTMVGPAPLIVYDASFFSEYSVRLWSAEANYVHDLRIPYDGWSVQTIIGYRHEEYSENLSFGGSFDNRTDYATDGVVNTGQYADVQSNRIDSKVHNYRNALQLGFRSELKQYGFTLGVEPKVAFGVGLIRARVNTQNAREPGDLSPLQGDPNLIINDPESTTDFDREFDFAPSAELNLYAKYDVTSWLKLRFGYNLTWMGRVGAADASIRYNTISAADPTTSPNVLDFGVDQHVSNRFVSAVTIGGEIIFP